MFLHLQCLVNVWEWGEMIVLGRTKRHNQSVPQRVQPQQLPAAIHNPYKPAAQHTQDPS